MFTYGYLTIYHRNFFYFSYNGDGGVMVSSLEVGAEGTGFESYY